IPERPAIDVDRAWQRPEQLAQSEMSVVAPAVHQRAHVVAAVTVDIDEARLWEQAMEIRHAHDIDARLVQDPSQTQPLEEITLRPEHRDAAQRYFFQRLGLGRVLDKTCINVMRVPYLHRLFPQAPFAYVHPHARATRCS